MGSQLLVFGFIFWLLVFWALMFIKWKLGLLLLGITLLAVVVLVEYSKIRKFLTKRDII